MNIIKGLKKLIHHIASYFKEDTKYPYISSTSIIDKSSIIYSVENLIMEDNTILGPQARIMNTRARFIMKKYSFSGPELLVATGNHMPIIGTPLIMVTNEMKDKMDTGHIYDQDVVVGEDVWLGARVTLLSGVHIGRGCIVAAGSVVTRSLPPYCVVGGIPAKRLKHRFTIDQIMEHEAHIYPEEERFSRKEIEEFLF